MESKNGEETTIEPWPITFNSPTGPVSHTVQDLFNVYNERLDRIEDDIRKIHETMMRTEQMVQQFISVVKPTIDDIIPMITNFAENPMVRMMLKGKK